MRLPIAWQAIYAALTSAGGVDAAAPADAAAADAVGRRRLGAAERRRLGAEGVQLAARLAADPRAASKVFM